MKILASKIALQTTTKLIMLFMILISIQCQKCMPYDDYIVKYNLNITHQNQNYQSRKQIYESNCLKNEKSNSINNYQMSLDAPYMDLNYQEIQKIRGIAPVKFSSNPKQTVQSQAVKKQDIKVSNINLPSTYSLVDQGFVTQIQNQGTCGCCWSFATIAMYETLLKMRNFTYRLSEEASLQCTSHYAPNNRKSSCSGGYFADALLYLQKVGAVLNSKYPYVSGDYGPNNGHRNTPGICSQSNRIIVGNSVSNVYADLPNQLIKYLLYTQGPVMVGIYANQNFNHYSSGIFNGCPQNSSNFINHAVLLVGYNDTQQSWLIKNSWSTNWGQNGFIRLSYNRSCGISSLLGNLQFTSFNANPQITITDASLLFPDAAPNFQYNTLMYLSLIIFSMIILF